MDLSSSDQAYCDRFLNEGRGPIADVGSPAEDALRKTRRLIGLASAPAPDDPDLRLEMLARGGVAVVLESLIDVAPLELTPEHLFAAFLRSEWVATRHLVHTVQPLYFALISPTGRAVPADDFEAFLEFELARPAVRRELGRLPFCAEGVREMMRWLPTIPAARLRALADLDRLVRASRIDPARASDLGDVLLGYRYRADLAAEGVERSGLSMPGAARYGLYTEYPHFAALWELLRPTDRDVFVDLGAGHGRAAFSLRAHGHQTRYVGYENVPARVAVGRRMIEGLNLDAERTRLVEADLSDPAVEIVPATYYFLFNPFPPSVFRRVLASLPRAAPFKLITANLSLFRDVERRLGADASVAEFFETKPDWLSDPRRLEIVDTHGARPFYVYASI